MSINNTKALTRGKAVIPARDGTTLLMTVTATDTVVTSISVPFKRSSGQGVYTLYVTTPTEGIGVQRSIPNVPVTATVSPTTYDLKTISAVFLAIVDVA